MRHWIPWSRKQNCCGIRNSVTSLLWRCTISLHWRNNGGSGVSNHQPRDCLLNRLFRLRSMKISKLRITGLCEGNSPVTTEFPAQMASNAENVSIGWRHHVLLSVLCMQIGVYHWLVDDGCVTSYFNGGSAFAWKCLGMQISTLYLLHFF